MGIYFWNLQALKSQLRQGSLPPPQAFRYLLIPTVLGALAMGSTPEATGWLGKLMPAANAAIVGFGTWYCYRANGGASGRDFLSRYISLGWVLAIRVVVACLPIGLLVGILAGVLNVSRGAVDTIKACGYLVIEAAILWRMGVHMADIRRHSESPAAV